jgi:cysteine desulfurase
MFRKKVFLDYAAGAPLSFFVAIRMAPWLFWRHGNPSALYALGVQARRAVEGARCTLAHFLEAGTEDIIFTSGGTEANTLAISGVCEAFRLRFPDRQLHIVTTAIEHVSILACIEKEERRGAFVTRVSPNEHGMVSAQDIIAACTPHTILISIGYANNEIGSIAPIADIGRGLLRLRKKNNTAYPLFHTDACQAAPYLNMRVGYLHVDLMTTNGVKVGGPQGVGALYLRQGAPIAPQILGGGQEHGLRSGTEHVAGIVGFGAAISALAKRSRQDIFLHTQHLQKYLWELLQTRIDAVELYGPEIGEHRLPNTLYARLPGVEAETLLLYLSKHGVYCAAGSACSAEATQTSHVLMALGIPVEHARECLRFSWGGATTKRDMRRAVKVLARQYLLLKK